MTKEEIIEKWEKEVYSLDVLLSTDKIPRLSYELARVIKHKLLSCIRDLHKLNG